MWNVILFDSEIREHLLPLTFTRPLGDLRIGMLTIQEKWSKWLGGKISFITQDYLANKFPLEYGDENIVINGSVCPSDRLCRLIRQMDFNEAYLQGEELIVAKLDREQLEKLINDEDIDQLHAYDIEDTPFLKINRLWDIFLLNGEALLEDFELLTRDQPSQPLSPSNRVIGDSALVYLAEGAQVEGALLNTTAGPIFVDEHAEIMEGCMIRGGLYLGAHSIIRMGARIYGPTTIGPWSKVGGEVLQSVIQGFSNKAHEGFLGHSVIGEWCNIGADTNTSNLKNNYEEVKVWSFPAGRFVPTGSQFGGLFMADHAKLGINSMINTGTVIGVSANVFGAGFPRNYIPSFAWGGATGFQTFQLDKAFDTAERMMQRRNKAFNIQERLILLRIFEETASFRFWEK